MNLKDYIRKAFTKKRVNHFFIAVLVHLYDLNYLNSTKSWLSNQNSSMVPKVTLILYGYY